MSQTVGYVLFDYAADEADEISINKGEVVTIIETYDDGWWLVGNNMDSGLVPSNYLTLEPQQEHQNEFKIDLRNSTESVRSNHHKISDKAYQHSPVKTHEKSSPRGNFTKPTELNRLKDMREQAETRINALR
jgi:hypothetical protein